MAHRTHTHTHTHTHRERETGGHALSPIDRERHTEKQDARHRHPNAQVMFDFSYTMWHIAHHKSRWLYSWVHSKHHESVCQQARTTERMITDTPSKHPQLSPYTDESACNF